MAARRLSGSGAGRWVSASKQTATVRHRDSTSSASRISEASVIEVWPTQVLVRPFVGVGILGGFTTFSTYVVDIQRLLNHRVPLTALAYLLATAVAAIAAAAAGLRIGRAAVRLKKVIR